MEKDIISTCEKCGGTSEGKLCRFCKVKYGEDWKEREQQTFLTKEVGLQPDTFQVNNYKSIDYNRTSCARCHSENTQSFEMVYRQGRSVGNFSGRSIDLNLNITATRGSIKNQSLLSSQLRPPDRSTPSFLYAIIAAIIIFLIFLFFILISSIKEDIFILLITLGLFIPLIVSMVYLVKYANKISNEYNKEYHKNYNKWKHSWICHRCGNMWTQGDPNLYIHSKESTVKDFTKEKFSGKKTMLVWILSVYLGISLLLSIFISYF